MHLHNIRTTQRKPSRTKSWQKGSSSLRTRGKPHSRCCFFGLREKNGRTGGYTNILSDCQEGPSDNAERLSTQEATSRETASRDPISEGSSQAGMGYPRILAYYCKPSRIGFIARSFSSSKTVHRRRPSERSCCLLRRCEGSSRGNSVHVQLGFVDALLQCTYIPTTYVLVSRPPRS